MWSTSISVRLELIDMDTGKTIEIVKTVPDPSSYRKAICILVTKLGDVLSAGRRKSWVLDFVWAKHLRGLQMYCKVKDVLLYGRVHRGVVVWCKDGKRYWV